MRGLAVIAALAAAGTCPFAARAALWDAEYMARLQHAVLLNEHEVLDALSLAECPVNKTCTVSIRDPFYPVTLIDDNFRNENFLINELPYYTVEKEKIHFPAFAPAEEWYMERDHDQSVCGVEIIDVDANKTVYKYRLQTLKNRLEAGSRFKITHQFHCGACSTLKDLYIYKAFPDLTRPAARCASEFPIDLQIACMRHIGFTQACAESWAFNARSTRNRCASICVKERFTASFTSMLRVSRMLKDAEPMTPCMQCDEYVSGPGFKYAAGRTRRSSGLNSSIERKPGEVYRHADHDYFS